MSAMNLLVRVRLIRDDRFADLKMPLMTSAGRASSLEAEVAALLSSMASGMVRMSTILVVVLMNWAGRMSGQMKLVRQETFGRIEKAQDRLEVNSKFLLR